jgi:CheY-like chemotaxis protein
VSRPLCTPRSLCLCLYLIVAVVSSIFSMPTMDGKECSRRIRQHEATCDKHCQQYIIAQTGYVTQEFQRECQASGMSDYISKPIQLDALSASLKRAYQDKINREGSQGRAR